MQEASFVTEQQAMGRALRSLIRRTPVSCPPGVSIADALRAMQLEGTGSIVIVGPEGSPLGIFTRHDILERVALSRRKLEEPMACVMTPTPRTLPAEATAYDAALLIAQHGVRHVPVVDGGRLIGVVSERDLFALQRVGIRSIRRDIAGATAVDGLKQVACDIRGLARDLASLGTAAEPLGLIISTLNDALTCRLVELELERHDLRDVEWGWLGFGSEGRYEQTISTDQDNGLIFAAGPGRAVDEARERLLPFAQTVNRMLDTCGYPLCEGGIMAGNPQWCLSLNEWAAHFDAWIADTDPQALLRSVIFFDFRLLHGSEDLAEQLHKRLRDRTAATPRFLRQMAGQAVSAQPPLGFLGDFVTERSPHGRDTLDLKKAGARLFVDAARVIGLASDVAHTSTAERLRQGGARSGVPPEEASAAVAAFFFIQSLRLRHQAALPDSVARTESNHIDLDELNEMDRRILKECLRQAGKLQKRLKLDYQLP
jgi:CBS domain-containing protein